MFKRTVVKIIGVAALTSCIFLAAVGGGLLANQESSRMAQEWLNKAKEEYGGITITMLVASHPSTEAFQTMAPEFEEATGIKVRWEVVEEGLLYDKAAMAFGTGIYDIVMICPEFTPGFAELGGLIDLTPYILGEKGIGTPDWFGYTDLSLAYREGLEYRGKRYGIPFAGETSFVFYRMDVFEKYGKKSPETLDDVLELAKFFDGKDWDNDGEKEAGFSTRIARGWEATWTWTAGFLFDFGGSIINPQTKKPTLNSEETIKSLEYLVELVSHGPVGIESFSFPEAWSAFQEGKAPLMIESTGAATLVENPEKSIAAGKTGYCKMPKGPVGAYAWWGAWGYAITSGSKHKNASWALITWLTSKYNSIKYLKAGGFPTRESILKDSKLQEEYFYYKATLEALGQAADLARKGYSVIPKIPEWMELSDIIGTYVSKAVIGELTPREACNAMQQEAEELLPY